MSTENNDAYKRIAELARDMSEHLPNDSATALGELIHNAVDHIPGASYAGITVVSRQNRDVATPAATHEVPRTLDALQQKHREGPCFDAAVEHDSYYISNLYGERRWPRFCADAIEQTPIQSIAAFQLFTTRDAVGALNLYSEIPGAFRPRITGSRVHLRRTRRDGLGRLATGRTVPQRIGQPRHHRAGQRHDHGALQRQRDPGIRSVTQAVSGIEHPSVRHRTAVGRERPSIRRPLVRTCRTT